MKTDIGSPCVKRSGASVRITLNCCSRRNCSPSSWTRMLRANQSTRSTKIVRISVSRHLLKSAASPGRPARGSVSLMAGSGNSNVTSSVRRWQNHLVTSHAQLPAFGFVRLLRFFQCTVRIVFSWAAVFAA